MGGFRQELNQDSVIQSLADEGTVLPKVFQLFFISHYYKNILALKNTID